MTTLKARQEAMKACVNEATSLGRPDLVLQHVVSGGDLGWSIRTQDCVVLRYALDCFVAKKTADAQVMILLKNLWEHPETLKALDAMRVKKIGIGERPKDRDVRVLLLMGLLNAEEEDWSHIMEWDRRPWGALVGNSTPDRVFGSGSLTRLVEPWFRLVGDRERMHGQVLGMLKRLVGVGALGNPIHQEEPMDASRFMGEWCAGMLHMNGMEKMLRDFLEGVIEPARKEQSLQKAWLESECDVGKNSLPLRF